MLVLLLIVLFISIDKDKILLLVFLDLIIMYGLLMLIRLVLAWEWGRYYKFLDRIIPK